MTETRELQRVGAAGLPDDMARRGIDWLHLPVRDFKAPDATILKDWPAASGRIRKELAGGGRVLVHCFGGCGRSGMAILRILCELGEEPDQALRNLRAVRACAVETEGQLRWAAAGFAG